VNDKERIAELADAFNRVCAENADFVAESIKADSRIAELEAENARLKAALDKYSEDEMLLIERCAKVCEVMGFKHSECPEMSEYCADAIRALKVERRKCERRVKQARQYFTAMGNERSGNDRRKT
jgi:hypothetical protein